MTALTKAVFFMGIGFIISAFLVGPSASHEPEAPLVYDVRCYSQGVLVEEFRGEKDGWKTYRDAAGNLWYVDDLDCAYVSRPPLDKPKGHYNG